MAYLKGDLRRMSISDHRQSHGSQLIYQISLILHDRSINVGHVEAPSGSRSKGSADIVFQEIKLLTNTEIDMGKYINN